MMPTFAFDIYDSIGYILLLGKNVWGILYVQVISPENGKPLALKINTEELWSY